MAVDPAPPPAVSAAVENELPTYRAVSPMAVASLILGLLSLLCFADLWFLVLAVAAVSFGLLADRKIARMPDVLTGRRLAQAGVAIGLVFGLSAVTISVVQGYLQKAEAARFGRMYAEMLEDRSLAECTWYRLAPTRRQEIEPERTIDELHTQREADMPPTEEEEVVIEQIKAQLAEEPGPWHVHLDEVEQHGVEQLQPWAVLRLAIEGPAKAGPAEEPAYAMLLIKSMALDGKREWWIDQLDYPYHPESTVLRPQPVDDGHGHGH